MCSKLIGTIQFSIVLITFVTVNGVTKNDTGKIKRLAKRSTNFDQ